MNRQVTMQEIADMAGVSTATVSRVIKGHPLVSEETRSRVQALIDEYNYVPNALASSLVLQKSNMLGMIVPDIKNPYFATMYTEAECYSCEHDYSLLMMSSESSQSIQSSINRLLNRQVDGLFVISSSIDQQPRDEAVAQCLIDASRRVPLVINNDPLPDLDLTYIAADSKTGFEKALSYLIALGHRKIAFIGGLMSVNSARLRNNVYHDTLREHGIDIPPVFSQLCAYDVDDGARGMQNILASGQMPTAVIVNNETISMGVVRCCYEHRLRIPEDISIISCDNTFLSRSIFPELTSIDIFPAKQGQAAIETLFRMIQGETVPKVTVIPSELVIRGSTAKPRSSIV